MCQPRAFSHASGVYHPDGGFLSLVPSRHYVPVVTDELSSSSVSWGRVCVCVCVCGGGGRRGGGGGGGG